MFAIVYLFGFILIKNENNGCGCHVRKGIIIFDLFLILLFKIVSREKS